MRIVRAVYLSLLLLNWTDANRGHQVAVATTSGVWGGGASFCGYQEWNLFNVSVMAPGIVKWSLGFGKFVQLCVKLY